MGTGGPELGDRLAVLGPHLHDRVPLRVVAERAGVPLGTARRCLAAYRVGGASRLSQSPRGDRGVRQIPVELVELVEGMALRRPSPKIAQVHRAVAGYIVFLGQPTATQTALALHQAIWCRPPSVVRRHRLRARPQRESDNITCDRTGHRHL